jgi:hypothetical protein
MQKSVCEYLVPLSNGRDKKKLPKGIFSKHSIKHLFFCKYMSEKQKKGLHHFLENLWFSKKISENSLGQIALDCLNDNLGKLA